MAGLLNDCIAERANHSRFARALNLLDMTEDARIETLSVPAAVLSR